MSYPVWVNGAEHGSIDPNDRGLAYGDGVFETLRVEKGRAIFLEEHFERLSLGIAHFGIPLQIDDVLHDLQRFFRVCPASCVVKIIVTRGAGRRGYLPDPDATPTCIFNAFPLSEYPARHVSEGVSAAFCTIRLSLQPQLAGHKHLNRLEQVLLRRELMQLGTDEALVCDMQGRVVEGVFSNLFMVRDGRLSTPRIEQSGVRGVMRAAIMRESIRQGLPVSETLHTPEDFLSADEVFFCNSVNGIWPVRSLAGRHWSPGPLTRHWQAFWQKTLDSI